MSSGKFIPNKDQAFESMANAFARVLARDPQKYAVSDEDCALLVRQVQEYRDALRVARDVSRRTPSAIRCKSEARKRAEEIIRRIANEIRVNGRITTGRKLDLGINERPKKLGRRTVPFAAPTLEYLGVPPRDGLNTGRHLIRFGQWTELVYERKPKGADRIEIFVDLVAPNAPIPQFPGQYLGGRPWYLGSFTKSPCKVDHPKPPVPMLVVYWGRWADKHGKVGPFSQTCQARVEGWTSTSATPHLEAAADLKQLANDPKYITMIRQLQIEQVTVERLLPDGAEARAAVRELEDATASPQAKQLPLTDAA